LVPHLAEQKDISAHGHPAATISENFPMLGAPFARLLPHGGKALRVVSPARRSGGAAIFGSLSAGLKNARGSGRRVSAR